MCAERKEAQIKIHIIRQDKTKQEIRINFVIYFETIKCNASVLVAAEKEKTLLIWSIQTDLKTAKCWHIHMYKIVYGVCVS